MKTFCMKWALQILPVTMRASVHTLVLVELFLSLPLGGLCPDLLVILLQRGKILAGLAELSLFHTLSDIPLIERERISCCEYIND